jgi:hypothetical protein
MSFSVSSRRLMYTGRTGIYVQNSETLWLRRPHESYASNDLVVCE